MPLLLSGPHISSFDDLDLGELAHFVETEDRMMGGIDSQRLANWQHQRLCGWLCCRAVFEGCRSTGHGGGGKLSALIWRPVCGSILEVQIVAGGTLLVLCSVPNGADTIL